MGIVPDKYDYITNPARMALKREEYLCQRKTEIGEREAQGWTFVHVNDTYAATGPFWWCRKQHMVEGTDFVRVSMLDSYAYGFRDAKTATAFALRWA